VIRGWPDDSSQARRGKYGPLEPSSALRLRLDDAADPPQLSEPRAAVVQPALDFVWLLGARLLECQI